MNNKIENIVHNNLGHILTSGTKKNYKRGLSYLKSTDNFTAKCNTIDKISKISIEFNKYIYGNPIPNSINNIGVSKNNFYTDFFVSEIDWFLLSVRKYKTELNLFLLYKKDFENNFLIGKYQDALNAIEKSETHIGYSLWSITSKFLIFEYTGSQDKAKILQSDILKLNHDGIFTSSLINFYSQRSEKKLSANRYDNDLKNTLNHVRSNLNKSNKDYYNFQLNFFENLEYSEIKDIIGFDYSNSIIDKYLTFRRIIIYCFSNGIFVTELFQKMGFIQKRINDDLFNTIFLLFDPQFKSDSFFDNNYLRIFDNFYSGLYIEVCSEIKKNILNNDIDFNLINIYARSLVLNNTPFARLIENSCIINEIAENLYNIYKRSSNPNESLYNLYQTSKNIDSFDINYQLNCHIKKEQNIKYNKNYFYLTGKKNDPLLIELFETNKENLNRVYAKLTSETYNSLALNYRLKLLNGDFDSVVGITESKLEIDKAKQLFQNKKYSESLIIWYSLFEKNQEIPPILEASIDYIFRILSELNRYDECIKWYVDSVISNPYLVYKIDAQNIHKALKKGRFKNIEINIYLPLFISLVSADENEKSFAIEMFCKMKGVTLPSEYFNCPDFEKDFLSELFFNFTCNNETLKYFKHLNTTKKRLDERINICNYLAINYEINKDNYIQELNLLTNELIIHEGTQKLDESKIYANDQAILNKELDEFEGLYNRYITISGLFLKNVKILTINKNELRYLDKKGEIEYSQNEIEYSQNADLDAFYDLFSLIREKFLYSKFGIVTYLSTRIRHGVLLGELRPELEKNNLIFYKNKLKDKYEPTSFWLNNPNLTIDEKNKLINLITNFSSKIDILINSIIKENIQIQLNGENEKGWFDYEYTNYELQQNSITLFYEENYKAFCKKVLDLLWLRTDENLDKIREVMQDEIKGQFVDLLNEFDTELHTLLGKNKIPEIFTALTSCSTNIQNKIDKIASWFKRSGKTYSDFQLNVLIEIICNKVQKAHPLKTLHLTLKNEFNETIKGEFYEHFNDFIRIFIENMLKHSIDRVINCYIELKKENNNLVIVFENDSISNDNEFQFENFGTGKNVDGFKLITEGKSGLMKARKTIKDDLKNESNELYITVKDGKFKVTVDINFSQIIE